LTTSHTFNDIEFTSYVASTDITSDDSTPIAASAAIPSVDSDVSISDDSDVSISDDSDASISDDSAAIPSDDSAAIPSDDSAAIPSDDSAAIPIVASDASTSVESSTTHRPITVTFLNTTDGATGISDTTGLSVKGKLGTFILNKGASTWKNIDQTHTGSRTLPFLGSSLSHSCKADKNDGLLHWNPNHNGATAYANWLDSTTGGVLAGADYSLTFESQEISFGDTSVSFMAEALALSDDKELQIPSQAHMLHAHGQ
jgi:hypothetical protein